MSELDMQKTIDTLVRRIENLEAVNAIQRLMAAYFNHHVLNPNEEINHSNEWVFFADREDSSLEVADNGIFLGFNNIKAFFELTRPPEGVTLPTGIMFWHDLATPQIVVANDGQTARGLWTSPGHETFGDHAEWCWGKVHADFIKIDGEWKIWHYHWIRVFRTPYDTSWTDFDQHKVTIKRPLEAYIPLGGDPSRILQETTYFKPYSKDEYVDAYPKTPTPYETWSDDRLPV